MAEKAGARASNDPAPKGHNAAPLTQDDLDDLQLVHMAEMRKHNDTLEAAMEAVRAVRKLRTRHRTIVRTDGFPLALMDEILEDEALPTHEVTDRELKRARLRFVANQPGGRDTAADDKLLPGFQDSFAEREATEAAWRNHGYNAGQRGLDRDPQKYEVPPEWWQLWQEQWHLGQARLAKAWETKQRIEGALPLAPADNSEGAGAEDQEAGDAGAAPAPETTAGPADGGSSEGGDVTDASPAGSEFTEATEGELAAQNPRRAIQERNDAAEEELEDPTSEPCEACGAPAGEPCSEDCPSDAVVREEA